MTLLAVTLGQPLPGGGWAAVTDRGERVEVPAAAAQDLHPVTGQRVVAVLDDAGTIVSIGIGGTSVGLPLG